MSAMHPRLRTTGPVIAATAALLLMAATPSWAAGPPQEGSGTGQVLSFVNTSDRTAGNNRIVERQADGVVDGPLDGTFTEQQRGVVHADGTVTFEGTLVFTGVVAGCGTGTITTRLQGQGQANPPLTSGTITVIDAGTNTVPAHGHGTIQQIGALVRYDVRYTCD
jgi:hypothetical protein